MPWSGSPFLPRVGRASRRGTAAVAISLIAASMTLAAAQQYPPSPYSSSGAAAPNAPYPGPETVAPNAPPPPQSETIPPPPRRAVVWQPGFWSWRARGWVWVPGRYVARPRVHARWVPGHWVQRPVGWVWVAGHWG